MRTAPERSLLTTVAEVDSLLEEDVGDLNMFATLFCADIDTTTGTISYVDGGHSLSFIRGADGTWKHLGSTGLPLALSMGEPHQVGTAYLEPGEALMTCSDGLLDLLDLDDPLGQIDGILAECGVDGAVEETMKRVERAKAPDDVTVIVVRRYA
ncbi:serine/threonine-protein phosphatase [Nesterenkonia pannonica]|uniref:serine/threonine-protein phosphatase n=1 Tax=Nesterenkonia pannonica TaxID=1548602 RepID=UPI002164273F|nr:serine/threonine-protein phosphatase [Nesterenkonia pannonica]